MKLKKTSKIATENICATSLFDEFEVNMSNENENNNQKLPLTLFQEIEIELLKMLFLENKDSESGDETDGPIQFIKNIVEKVKKDFDDVVVDEEKKTFLSILTKIFATLLSVNADNIEKIINLIKNIFIHSDKTMVRTKLVPKRVNIRR